MSSKDLMSRKTERLQLKLEELDQAWKEISAKIPRLRKILDKTTRPEEQLKLEDEIADLEKKRQKIEDEIESIEVQLDSVLNISTSSPLSEDVENKPSKKVIKKADTRAATKAETSDLLTPVVLGVNCPSCSSPLLARQGRKGAFIGCSTFPGCKYTSNNLDELCPECTKSLSIKVGKRGFFIGCTGFPICRYTRNIPASES